MTEGIAAKIVELVSTGRPVQGQQTGAPIVPLYLSEAETGDYPYAVFDHSYTMYRDKDDRVSRISADDNIHVFSKSFDEADELAEAIRAVLDSGMHDDQYRAVLRSVDKDCTQNVWDITLNYRINQYK